MPANRCPNPSCEYFNRALPNNAKVCPWCSTPLGNVIPPQGSNPPPAQPTPPIQEQPNYQPPPSPNYSNPNPNSNPNYSTQYQERGYTSPPPPAPSVPSSRLPVFKLIHSTGREFYLSGEVGSLGRRTQSMPTPPEIDLTGIPQEGIVSRRHARIFWDWSQNAYMLVDTSTNGIYLNGNLLNAGVSYRILNGDTLQLGQDNLVTFTVSVG
ncbi:FHA domain-containing protein [Dulcicalothrix desertica PCC 7102]|uniref:FHA domain-containing protein n=1 Tax=Dulcicalothrix desertica PCC 7102 TaxID=232991 RepID=A0A433VPW2_9CYAN|nr:FHA domain-containing protein [Dulcicalothrix desertica]RUT08129.1 FHA domain-containing protein [Dulcicalothrix desertica PCC 7102]TWH39998.1 pSer/pThr/pTyr-binding forkhead associated (FHA) protein [Dulcicalothrix desertica PCC 7102]